MIQPMASVLPWDARRIQHVTYRFSRSHSHALAEVRSQLPKARGFRYSTAKASRVGRWTDAATLALGRVSSPADRRFCSTRMRLQSSTTVTPPTAYRQPDRP